MSKANNVLKLMEKNIEWEKVPDVIPAGKKYSWLGYTSQGKLFIVWDKEKKNWGVKGEDRGILRTRDDLGHYSSDVEAKQAMEDNEGEIPYKGFTIYIYRYENEYDETEFWYQRVIRPVPENDEVARSWDDNERFYPRKEALRASKEAIDNYFLRKRKSK